MKRDHFIGQARKKKSRALYIIQVKILEMKIVCYHNQVHKKEVYIILEHPIDL